MSATTNKIFNSKVSKLNSFASNISNDAIKSEPMFFNSDLKYALENGGEITKSFLNALPLDWINEPLVFDSRVHMLMPGWHHDDVPRADIPVGQHFITSSQPDYDNPRYRSEHIMGLVNASVCPTLFATGSCEMPAIPDGELIYRNWHNVVENLVNTGVLISEPCEDRQLYYFDCDSFHTGQKSVSNGWRWFGRVSRKTDRLDKITNEIRVNAQVYLEFPMEGW